MHQDVFTFLYGWRRTFYSSKYIASQAWPRVVNFSCHRAQQSVGFSTFIPTRRLLLHHRCFCWNSVLSRFQRQSHSIYPNVTSPILLLLKIGNNTTFSHRPVSRSSFHDHAPPQGNTKCLIHPAAANSISSSISSSSSSSSSSKQQAAAVRCLLCRSLQQQHNTLVRVIRTQRGRSKRFPFSWCDLPVCRLHASSQNAPFFAYFSPRQAQHHQPTAYTSSAYWKQMKRTNKHRRIITDIGRGLDHDNLERIFGQALVASDLRHGQQGAGAGRGPRRQ